MLNSPVFRLQIFITIAGAHLSAQRFRSEPGACVTVRQMSSVPGSGGEYEALEVRNGSRGIINSILETEIDVVSCGKLMGFPVWNMVT